MVRRRLAFGPAGVATLTFLGEIAVITLTAIAACMAYHWLALGTIGSVRSFALVGGLTGILFAIPFLSRNEYRVASFLDGRRGPARIVGAWTYAFLALAGLAFLSKTTASFSRGAVLLFAMTGLIMVFIYEGVTGALIKRLLRSGRVAPRRLMLVGKDDDIRRYSERRGLPDVAARVVAYVSLPTVDPDAAGMARLSSALDRAAEQARAVGVDDILLLGALDDAAVSRCIDIFHRLPVGIHRDAGPALDQASEVRIARVGAVAAVSLTEPPLSPFGAVLKRLFDIVVASIGLVLLAPLFLAVAIMIRRESAGPAFFRQRRQGFNQREFRIFKFRTMTTLDDGDVIRQAKAGDVRITSFGAKLRRWNIDELPQLINVLRGEMSIVGPRPHAIAHDRIFEKQIDVYPRRLNVKPGITGWAQVNGYRGETDTDEKLRGRVEHDLYYIDRWSVWFDVYIILLTIVSPKAYRNAL
ncbi:MAG TPA: exopolysaccharide biosynthesis polyprenyl glycosylphosphotransferase [Hyphomicrobiaceae bacterium]|nr:exopolysaccharide biosynthesis polyprenyl glycosylphosphotransferase [Hyphomicrobiaceae bacterium]